MDNALFMPTAKTYARIMENKPTIYVLAGPNGIGKTTVNQYYIPSEVPYINADDIAKQLRERLNDINVQELANAEALEQMNKFIYKRQDFAIETNLADEDTWLFLVNIQRLGYLVCLTFFSTSDVDICINRVNMRYLQGGHFVRPDIVKMRYENGLKLLRYYKAIPDRLFFNDNTVDKSIRCLEIQKGTIVFQIEELPAWVQFVCTEEDKIKTTFSSIEEVREKYRKMNQKPNSD